MAPTAVTKAPAASATIGCPESSSPSKDALQTPTPKAKISSKTPGNGMGSILHEDGECTIRIWAPHAKTVHVELYEGHEEVPLQREGHHHSVRLASGALTHGARYRVMIHTHDGRVLLRRDPYARRTDFETEWCYVEDVRKYKWVNTEWRPPFFDYYAIYELHVGSFTPEGSFKAAIGKLKHVSDLGFTCVQVMPILEHSDEWGYNPRQFLSLHGDYGTPTEFKEFVDEAHGHGLAVIADVVLHHGAVRRNSLWEYDGWHEHNNGGIYHEKGADTEWGRSLAHWKVEVRDMLRASCALYLDEYHCDGLRFDSANDLSQNLCRDLTGFLHGKFPGRILTAEVTPENPKAIHERGFDNLWIHSGYFDVIHQHRALGRGHHGGGEYMEGWDLPRLRTIMGLHYGFSSPTQCTKYLLGSHDQVGCKNNGCVYEDYRMIGGMHRYSCDQFGGGRWDEWGRSATRAWFLANCCAAGVPMMFMGSEWAQPGWWHNMARDRRPDWTLLKDEVGSKLSSFIGDALHLRKEYKTLRLGHTNTLHEDRENGVLAVDRVLDGHARLVFVINAGRSAWCNGEYGVHVGGNGYALREVLSSNSRKYGGWDHQPTNEGKKLPVHDGKVFVNLPSQSSFVMVAEQL